MKIKKVIIIAVPLVFIGIISAVLLIARRPDVRDFCLGLRRCEVLRLALKGQGRNATLIDADSLRFLVDSTKFRALPESIPTEVAYSYEAKLFDKWGSLGDCSMSVGASSIRLTYIGGPLDVEDFSFITIGTNAPPKLKELIAFLLFDRNRGKSWEK
jgi:hypothetical protein